MYLLGQLHDERPGDTLGKADGIDEPPEDAIDVGILPGCDLVECGTRSWRSIRRDMGRARNVVNPKPVIAIHRRPLQFAPGHSHISMVAHGCDS